MGDDDDEDTTIQAVVPNERTRPRGVALLTVLAGRSVGQVFRLLVGETIIGRASTADVQLTDDGVSRRHARIDRARDGTAKITDLQSTNGTYVNGRRIEAEVLREGDRVRVGKGATFDFRYESGEDAPEDQRSQPAYENLAATLDTLAKLHRAGGHIDQAVSALRRTLSLRERKLGSDHPAVASILDHLGSALRDQGELTEALTCHERALAIIAGKSGVVPPEAAHMIANHAECLLRLGRTEEAAVAAARAIGQLEHRGAPEIEVARARFVLARASHRQGDSAKALALARRARSAYLDGGRTHKDVLEEIDGWIAAHEGASRSPS